VPHQGHVVLIAGPSGSGKTSLLDAIMPRLTDRKFHRIITQTTRPPREGEVAGEDYFFVSRSQFQSDIEAEGLIEWTEYKGEFYGTPVFRLPHYQNYIGVVTVDGVLKHALWGNENTCDEELFLYDNDVIRTIYISASRYILRQRLEGRGEENIDARLEGVMHDGVAPRIMRWDAKIKNDSDVETGAHRLLSAIDDFKN